MPHGGGIHAPEASLGNARSVAGPPPGPARRLPVLSGPRVMAGCWRPSATRIPVIFLEPVRCIGLAAPASRRTMVRPLTLDVCYKNCVTAPTSTTVTWGCHDSGDLEGCPELENDGVIMRSHRPGNTVAHRSMTASWSRRQDRPAVIMHEAARNCGVGAEIAATWPKRGSTTCTHDTARNGI